MLNTFIVIVLLVVLLYRFIVSRVGEDGRIRKHRNGQCPKAKAGYWCKKGGSECGWPTELPVEEKREEAVCVWCHGDGYTMEDEYDGDGQCVGRGTLQVTCDCQKRDDDS